MKRGLTTLAASALLGLSLFATTAGAATPTPGSPDAVIQWNRILLGIQAVPGAQPATVQPTYELAVMHAAIYDAVAAIVPGQTPFLTQPKARPTASVPAAAIVAAHDTLAKLYPTQVATLDADESQMLVALAPTRDVNAGIAAGHRAAARILAARANDGSTNPLLPYTSTNAPGDFAPPGPAAFTHWSAVKPFELTSAKQFRPAAPPALTSQQYADAINQVKTLGVATGSTRTDEQTQIGTFWNPTIWGAWNNIAATVALQKHSTLVQNARTFALLNLSLGDGAIAMYDAKYTYRLWRPISAIRGADADNNPATVADPAWTPLANTPADPSYPGAHSTISGAASTVLASVYGDNAKFSLTSTALPGVTRSFTSFSGAAREAGLSRIYIGVHTSLDDAAGQQLGRDVANDVLTKLALPRAARGRRVARGKGHARGRRVARGKGHGKARGHAKK